MYSYYFAALFGPEVQRKLERVKKSITLIQMVTLLLARTQSHDISSKCSLTFFQIQFTIILIQCALSLARGCDVPHLLLFIYVPNVVLIFYMFYDFFKKAYNKKSDKLKAN